MPLLPEWFLEAATIAEITVQTVATVFITLTFFVYRGQLAAMQGQLQAAERHVSLAHDATLAQNFMTLMNFLEAEHVQEALRMVLDRLSSASMDSWAHEGFTAARIVCSSFDCAALLARQHIVPVEPLIENWGPIVISGFRTLEPYIDSQRREDNPLYSRNYEWLYQMAIGAQGSI
jgi:hypothetical protein